MNVTLESVQVEKRIVEGYAQPVECLVVRLRHDAGKPILVQLAGLQSKGEEHQFYAKAGKVTAVFRGISQAQAQDNEFILRLTSLNALKNDKKNTFHLSAQDFPLPVPDGADGPIPVWEVGRAYPPATP